MFHESEILDRLSHPLRSRIALLKCHDVLTALSVLHDENLAREIASRLERVVFVAGDAIIHHGDHGRGMYFISSGSVEVGPRHRPLKLALTHAHPLLSALATTGALPASLSDVLACALVCDGCRCTSRVSMRR